MVRSRKKHLAVFCIAIVCAAALILLFPKSVGKGNGNTPLANILTDSITRIVCLPWRNRSGSNCQQR